MITPARFPFIRADARGYLMPYLPLTLQNQQQRVDVQGLLDSGATINVLPYSVGIQLGLDWRQQSVSLPVGGNLSQAPAYAVVIDGLVASFSPVRLAFAWSELDTIPIILGQTNFFCLLMFASIVLSPYLLLRQLRSHHNTSWYTVALCKR